MTDAPKPAAPLTPAQQKAVQRAVSQAARAKHPVKPTSSVVKSPKKKTHPSVPVAKRKLVKKHWSAKGVGFPHDRITIAKQQGK